MPAGAGPPYDFTIPAGMGGFMRENAAPQRLRHKSVIPAHAGMTAKGLVWP